MRNRFAVIVVIAALASATTISLTGQEEPLPRVTPRGTAGAAAPQDVSPPPRAGGWQSELLVVLPSDPILVERTVTLAEAARDNDYATFHSLFLQAREQGRDVSAYAALDEVWTFAVTDPVGAFYGADKLDRLTRAYPALRAYIDPYRIVDGRGRAFYPSSETRTFLLAEALRGAEPAAAVALTQSRRSSTVTQERAPATRPATRRATTPRATARTTPTRAATTATRQAPVQSSQTSAPPIARNETPLPAATTAPLAAAPAVSEQAASTTAPTATEVPTTTEAAATQPPPAEPVPTPVTEPAAAQQTTDVPAAEAEPSATGRGLLLLVIGLIGVGILALMLRTPREEMPRSIIDHSADAAPKNGEKPHATVEPIRKKGEKAPPRQTGTHS